MTTQTIRQIIARSGLDAYNEEISAACDAIDEQIAKLEQQGEAVAYLMDGALVSCTLPVGFTGPLYTAPQHPAADLTDEQLTPTDQELEQCFKKAAFEVAQREADKLLIAEAPNLLFQLLAAANYIDTLGGDSKSYRAAIAKATQHKGQP